MTERIKRIYTQDPGSLLLILLGLTVVGLLSFWIYSQYKYIYVKLTKDEAVNICGANYKAGNYKLAYHTAPITLKFGPIATGEYYANLSCSIISNVDIKNKPDIIARGLLQHDIRGAFEEIYSKELPSESSIDLTLTQKLSSSLTSEQKYYIQSIIYLADGTPVVKTPVGKVEVKSCKWDELPTISKDYSAPNSQLLLYNICSLPTINTENINKNKVSRTQLYKQLINNVACIYNKLERKSINSWI